MQKQAVTAGKNDIHTIMLERGSQPDTKPFHSLNGNKLLLIDNLLLPNNSSPLMIRAPPQREDLL